MPWAHFFSGAVVITFAAGGGLSEADDFAFVDSPDEEGDCGVDIVATQLPF